MIPSRVRLCQVLTCGEKGSWSESAQTHTSRLVRALQRGSRLCQSVFMAPLWSWYTGRAQSRQGCFHNAPIESEGELPALPLSKHHVNYSCKGQRRSSDNTEQRQSCSPVCITKILSRRVGAPHVGGSRLVIEKYIVTLLIATILKVLAFRVF